MSDVILGTVETYSGDLVDVILDDDGDVTLSRRKASGRETILVPAERDKLIGLLQRAAMPGQPAAEAHECGFPCQPPHGTIFAPGPCSTCGKPYLLAQAERQLADAQADLAAVRAATAGQHGSGGGGQAAAGAAT